MSAKNLFVWRISILFVVVGVASNSAASDEFFRCEQLYPVFCQNIHVGCAGRTSIPVSGFSIARKGKQVSIAFDDGSGWQVEVSTANEDTVLRRLTSRDWIRIERDGRFSLRIYRNGNALMALGQCVK